MRRKVTNLVAFIILLIALIGCSNEVPKEFDLKDLTRVDVQIQANGNSEDDLIIAEKDKINDLRKAFGEINWEPNVKAEMSRKEDVIATLFFTFDKNMPERLCEYFIWFNQGGGTATFIDKEKNTFGTLDKENTKTVKDILLNT
ncbi:hypothetical protein [Bacillus massiliigorillae]|uniref:hypothetical protein n=1 Tax=Bacillus massiliigorillae TaxID=1243664 RepID=UPI00039A5063|nr:hypothetical protein [Bacillus massiliigorillae]